MDAESSYKYVPSNYALAETFLLLLLLLYYRLESASWACSADDSIFRRGTHKVYKSQTDTDYLAC